MYVSMTTLALVLVGSELFKGYIWWMGSRERINQQERERAAKRGITG